MSLRVPHAGRGNLIDIICRMHKAYYIYILSNFKRNVIYVGVTNNLEKRVWEHKQDLVRGFSKKYKVHDLIYFEIFSGSISAIEREKQIKSRSRKKKDELIKTLNPQLKDLYQEII